MNEGFLRNTFLKREIEYDEEKENYFFTCPYCGHENIVNDGYCNHIVYVYDTVNLEKIHSDERFMDVLIKLISTDPYQFIDDFNEFIEEYIDEPGEIEEETLIIEEKLLKEILDDRITPYVIEMVIREWGMPIAIEGLIEYSLYDPYIGGGTYFYLVSDESFLR